MNVKKSDKHKIDVQMYLSEKEDWTSSVPVVTGIAVAMLTEDRWMSIRQVWNKEERLTLQTLHT